MKVNTRQAEEHVVFTRPSVCVETTAQFIIKPYRGINMVKMWSWLNPGTSHAGKSGTEEEWEELWAIMENLFKRFTPTSFPAAGELAGSLRGIFVVDSGSAQNRVLPGRKVHKVLRKVFQMSSRLIGNQCCWWWERNSNQKHWIDYDIFK